MRPLSKGLRIVFLLLLLPSGCLHVHVHPTEALRGGSGLEPGDRVVARWQNGFHNATVITVNKKLVTVAWDTPPPEKSMIHRDRLSLQGARTSSVRNGDWMLCRVSASWTPCRVVSTSGGKVLVERAEGETRVAAEDMVSPPKDSRALVKRRGEESIARNKLLKAISPNRPLPTGEPVVVGHRVLAPWSNSGWYEGTVQSIDDANNNVTVEWRTGQPTIVSKEDVVVLPDAPMNLHAGDLAFCKWSTSARWWPARIDSIVNNSVEVTYSDGTKGQVKGEECLQAIK